MKQMLMLGFILAMVAGCATTPEAPAPCTLTILSEPGEAHILSSKKEEGPWRDYRKKEGLHITPSKSTLGPGDFFWVKVEKPGYYPADPRFVRAAPGEEVKLEFKLERPAVVRVFSEPEQGARILVADTPDGAYHPWFEEEESLTPAQGEMAVGSTVWMKATKEEYEDAGPEKVEIESDAAVDITFTLRKTPPPRPPDTSKPAVDVKSILLASQEVAHVDGETLSGSWARDAVAAALKQGGKEVTVASGPFASATALSRQARQYGNYLALFVAGEAEQHDKFGEFYSFKAGVDYTLLKPASDKPVATGRVQALTPKRQLSAKTAAIDSLRAAGKKAAAEILPKLTEGGKD